MLLGVLGVLIGLTVHAEERPGPALMTHQFLAVQDGMGAYGHCALCVVSRGGVPVAAFGLNKLPKEKARYTYLLIFKAPGKHQRGLTSMGGGRGSNNQLDFTGSVEFDGRKVAVHYQFEADLEKSILRSESLRVDDRAVKPDGPRVYLVDLSQEKAVCRAVKADLPNAVPDLTEREHKTWAVTVEKAIAQLKKEHATVRKFLE
jgi:hypothetical protein